MNTCLRPRSLSLLAVFAGVMLLAAPAWAHKVNVLAYPEGDKIIVQGYFGGKSKAVDCPVEVFGPDGKLMAQSRTDKSGICSFAMADLTKVPVDLLFVLHAGEGHRADYTLKASELPAVNAPGEQRPVPESAPPTESHRPASSPAQAAPAVGAQEPAHAALERMLDSRLQPLADMLKRQNAMIAELKDKGPSISEIIGGIGWILGLAGVAAYFMSRTNGRKNN